MTKNEADAQLRQAIIDHAEAYGLSSDAEMLSDYAVVSHWVWVQDQERSTYNTHFSTENIPMHTAIGLLRTGEHLLVEQMAREG